MEENYCLLNIWISNGREAFRVHSVDEEVDIIAVSIHHGEQGTDIQIVPESLYFWERKLLQSSHNLLASTSRAKDNIVRRSFTDSNDG